MNTFKLVSCLGLLCGCLNAASIVLPNAQTGSLGNDDSGPLSGFFSGSAISQNIWAANQFSSVGGSLLITQFAFRMKPGTGPINATATSFSFFMSTSPFSPSTMTTTFATNRGADFTQVVSGTGTLWSSPGCAGPGVCPFDIIYTLTTPFLYNPSAGSLLIEQVLTGYNGVGSGRFDVQNYPSAIGATVGQISAFLPSPTGVLEYSDNVTRLTFTTVPEPGSSVLTMFGVGAFVFLRRRASQFP